jgi:hypothetical protein
MAEKPLRLKVLERIVEILKAIEGDGGATFWFTPNNVVKRFADPEQLTGYPYYMVAPDSSPQSPEPAEELLDWEFFAVSVKAWIDLEGDEPTTKLEKCLADVRKAVMADCLNTAGASSLAALGIVSSAIDTVETDGGVLSLEGRAYFDQRFIFKLPLSWGSI